MQVIDSVDPNETAKNDHEYTFKHEEINNNLYLNLTINIISGIQSEINNYYLYIYFFSQIQIFSWTLIGLDVYFNSNEYILEEF